MQPLLTRLFPTPSFLALPTVGIDFSDATMRFVELKETLHGIIPARHGQEVIPEGCMAGGRIIDEAKFTAFLSEIRKTHKFKYVRVAIPESQTYSFTLSLDTAAVADVRGAIELVLEDNIPLRSFETIFDHYIIESNEQHILVKL